MIFWSVIFSFDRVKKNWFVDLIAIFWVLKTLRLHERFYLQFGGMATLENSKKINS